MHLGSTDRPFHDIPNLENVPHSSTSIDASQTNSEMQPHSLSILFSPSHSHSQNSSDIFMFDNFEISNSPSLKIMMEPKINIDTHHSEDNDLLEYQSFISSMVVDTVLQNKKLQVSNHQLINHQQLIIHRWLAHQLSIYQRIFLIR